MTFVHEHVGWVPIWCVSHFMRRSVIKLYFTVINDTYFLVVIFYPFRIGAVCAGEWPIMPIIHTTTIVYDYSFQVICVIITQLRGMITIRYLILYILTWMTMSTQKYQFLRSHMLWTLQMLIIFKIQIRKSVNFRLILGLRSQFIIFIFDSFYFFWFVIYLIVFYMQ